MFHAFRRKAAFTAAAAGAALILGAGLAFAAGGWTIVAAPPTRGRSGAPRRSASAAASP